MSKKQKEQLKERAISGVLILIVALVSHGIFINLA